MSLLKRLSDGFWSYVSPSKSNKTPLPTPKTEPPTFKKPPIPARSPPRPRSSQSIITSDPRYARSMSPGERVGNWRIRSPSSQASSSATGSKRKRDSVTESPSAGRAGKLPRMDGDGMDFEYDNEYDNQLEGDMILDGEEQEEEEEEDHGSSVRFPSTSPRHQRYKSPTLDDYEEDEDAMSVDNTLVVSEGAEYTPPKRRIADIPEESRMRHIETDELRAKGWDDDYINLIQRIALRGHEPLLPSYLHFEYKFMPDGLFEKDDDAFIASTRGEHFKAGKALEKLIELGGRMRDRIETRSSVTPEQQVKRSIQAYMKWAIEDSGLDKKTVIPVLAVECQPAETDVNLLKENALAKCKSLANRYREALRVRRTVEISPGSRSSNGTILSYPLPTFYALIASHQIVAIMAYKPDSDRPELESMAYFNFKDRNYDVWNALALAILVNHVRNVQMRIAEDTGIGEKQTMHPDEIEEKLSDPDA